MLVLWLLPLHLSEVLARVEAEGPEQRLATSGVEVARADVRTARMFPNPGITFSGAESEPVLDVALQLRLPLFGQRGAHIRAAEDGVEQVRQEASAARWRLRHDARVAYYAAVRADDQVAVAAELETLTAKVAAIARERSEVGAGTRLDQRQAELVHVRAQQDVSDRRAIARVAHLELARQLGISVEELGTLADPLGIAGSAPSLDELLSLARAAHPELRAARSERQASLSRAKAARADLRPAPIVELGLQLLNPSTCGSTSYCVGPRGGIGLELPLFNWNGGPVERARAEARVAELRTLAVETRLEAGVRAAWENLTAAQARARFFDGEYLPNAVEVEAMAQEAFTVGRSGILPLIEAERALLEARLGRSDALFAVQAARADLEEQSGVALSAP
jgi:cobalt-zinc-cadmium efflux system outer membrane protein